MPTQSVGARKPTATTPAIAILQNATADKLLLAAMQPFVALTVMLARKSFTADTAHEGSLVCVRA